MPSQIKVCFDFICVSAFLFRCFADSSEPSVPPYINAPPYPSGIHLFPGLATSPYNYGPSCPTGAPPFPNLAAHMPSPLSYNHSPPFRHGRKRAVIVGVSCKNTSHELKGCINDVKCMKYLLINKF
ncbi:hypothetical protein L1887_10252 [Cichorium endivia]|nr:hypothetical protein L1887_10252 [Cichorium endivia]